MTNKTQKEITAFFKTKQEQLETLQPRSQMILNDQPLYPTNNDIVESEWTNEKQLEWELSRQKQSHQLAMENLALKNSELYTDNVLLKRQIVSLQSEIDKLKNK